MLNRRKLATELVPVCCTAPCRLFGTKRTCRQRRAMSALGGAKLTSLKDGVMSAYDPNSDIGRIEIPRCSGLLQTTRCCAFKNEAREPASASIQNNSGQPQGPDTGSVVG